MVLASLLGRVLIIHQTLFRGNELGEDEDGKLSGIVADNTERLKGR